MHLFTRKAALAAALAIASVISPAIAEQKDRGIYATLGAGIGVYNDSTIPSGSGGGKILFDNGFSGDIGLGYDFGSIRTEFTYNKIKNEVDKIQGYNSNVALEFETFFLSAYYDFRSDKAWQPYVGIGVGSTTIYSSSSYSTNLNLVPGNVTMTSGKVALGLNYRASDNFDIYGEYSAQRYDDFKIGTYTYSDDGMNIATLGTRIKF